MKPVYPEACVIMFYQPNCIHYGLNYSVGHSGCTRVDIALNMNKGYTSNLYVLKMVYVLAVTNTVFPFTRGEDYLCTCIIT